MTPAGSENSSHGSRVASVTSAICIGSRVTAVASHGIATAESPSPKFETTDALHSFQ